MNRLFSVKPYVKFGFQNLPGLVLDGVPPEVFFALSFDGHAPRGSVAFHEAFRADGEGEGPSRDLRRG